MNENNMIDSVKTVNNYCSNEYSVKDIATTCVPNIVKVFDGLAQGVFCNAAHNCKDEVSFGNLKDPVSIFKLSRYLFPQQDPEPTKAALKDVSVLQRPGEAGGQLEKFYPKYFKDILTMVCNFGFF